VRHVVDDIRREIPLGEARHVIALAGTYASRPRRLAADEEAGEPRVVGREAFLALCDQLAAVDLDQLVEVERLPPAEAETLVPGAPRLPRAAQTRQRRGAAGLGGFAACAGCLLDLVRAEEGHGIEDFSRQVLASAGALGEKYRYDMRHAHQVHAWPAGSSTSCARSTASRSATACSWRSPPSVHDIGNFVSLRAHHKHTQYLLSVSEIFGSPPRTWPSCRTSLATTAAPSPQRTHLPYVALDRDERVAVDKLAALLRLANALDADHLQRWLTCASSRKTAPGSSRSRAAGT